MQVIPNGLQRFLAEWNAGDYAFHASLLVEAAPEPETSAMRILAPEPDQGKVWVVNVKKHRKVCGPKAKHHETDCGYRYPKDKAAKADPIMLRHAATTTYGDPVYVNDGRYVKAATWAL